MQRKCIAETRTQNYSIVFHGTARLVQLRDIQVDALGVCASWQNGMIVGCALGRPHRVEPNYTCSDSVFLLFIGATHSAPRRLRLRGAQTVHNTTPHATINRANTQGVFCVRASAFAHYLFAMRTTPPVRALGEREF